MKGPGMCPFVSPLLSGSGRINVRLFLLGRFSLQCLGTGQSDQWVFCSAFCFLSHIATVISLSVSLGIAPLLAHTGGSICQKERLPHPQHCRQGQQSHANHLSSCQRLVWLGVSAPLLMLFALHKTLTSFSSIQSLFVFQEPSSETATPGQPSLDVGAAYLCPAPNWT